MNPERVPAGPILGALAAAALSAALMAWVALRLHPTAYIPLLVAAFMGYGIGSSVAWVRRRAHALPLNSAGAIAGFAAISAYFAYHVMVYQRVTKGLVERLGRGAGRLASDPFVEVMGFLEHLTGETGLMAYWSFTSEGQGVLLSPLGLLGGLEPGPLGAAIATVLEAGLAIGVAVWVARWRGVSTAPPALNRALTREVIARTDADTLAAAMHAVDRGDPEEAGRILRCPVSTEAYSVALCFDPKRPDGQHILEVAESPYGRPGPVRARRELSSWDAQALWDELRLAR